MIADQAFNESELSEILEARPPGGDFYIDLGWENFENGSFITAISYFDSCIMWFADYADDGYNGLGWCHSYTASGSDDNDYKKSKSNFLLSDNPEATAGLGLVYNVLNDYYNAIVTGKQVIAQDPEFLFSHDGFITVNTIRLSIPGPHLHWGIMRKWLHN